MRERTNKMKFYNEAMTFFIGFIGFYNFCMACFFEVNFIDEKYDTAKYIQIIHNWKNTELIHSQDFQICMYYGY